jgi:LPS-assembly lipoprotein
MLRHWFGFALLLCGGCGFHLAGSDIHSEIDRAYVRAAPSVELTDVLVRSLRQSDVTVLDAPDPKAVTIELLSERVDRRTATTTPQAQAADYELELEVAYRIIGPDAAELVPERTASITRLVPVDRSNLVGSREQESLVHDEMQRALVQQILTSLAVASRGKTR